MTEREISLEIGHSVLKGTENVELGVRKFLGVPYALPPVGDLRFRRPQPLPRDYLYGEAGTLECGTFRGTCPQPIYRLGDKPMSRPPGTHFSEDCLYLNIWLPSGAPPAEGWPVMAWIHGGWFQIGNPLQGAENDPSELISDRGFGLGSVVVAIGYRLNIFGFLATEGLSGNFGLWDQRAGLEWIHQNISVFGGDSGNVTVAGLSAGANSVHQQLNYEFFHHPTAAEPIFHRAIMYSNAISSQSKPPAAAADQFDEVCARFDIPSSLSLGEKIGRLRSIDAARLVEALPTLKYHTFRHVTDGDFISPDLVLRGRDGRFAAEFHRRGFSLIIGEVEDEETVYRAINPPLRRDQFIPELENYYAAETSRRLFERYPFPPHHRGGDDDDPDDADEEGNAEAWKDHFGKIVAGAQVRAPTRRFVAQLASAATGTGTGTRTGNVFRYRISLRLQLLSDLGTPESFGIGHGMCQPIWWYQRRLGYRQHEVEAVTRWLAPWKRFIHGEDEIGWGTSEIEQFRRLLSDGTIAVERDPYWREYQDFADVLMPPMDMNAMGRL